MIFSLTGLSFITVCAGMGGIFTYIGIDRKYKLIDRKEAARILAENFGVIKKGLEEEAATVNNKIAELEEENMNFINLITELKEKNELLETMVTKKAAAKKNKKKNIEEDIDNVIELHAEEIVEDYGDFIPIPTDDEVPTTKNGRKKNK